MTNDPLLKRLNALLDEKEAEALDQGAELDVDFDEENITDADTGFFQDESETYDNNRSNQKENLRKDSKPEPSYAAPENELSILDESADVDAFPEAAETIRKSLKFNVFLILLSFILGGIFFQVFLSTDTKGKMSNLLTDSLFQPDSTDIPKRISVLEDDIRDLSLGTNSMKVISSELSAAVSDLTDLNERFHGSLIDLQARVETLEEKNLIKGAKNNIKIGSDQLYGEKNPWFVNFGTYNDIRLARVWADRIENEGFSVAIETKPDSNPKQYRVRIIELASSKDAADVASKLTSRYKLPPLWIDEY